MAISLQNIKAYYTLQTPFNKTHKNTKHNLCIQKGLSKNHGYFLIFFNKKKVITIPKNIKTHQKTLFSLRLRKLGEVLDFAHGCTNFGQAVFENFSPRAKAAGRERCFCLMFVFFPLPLLNKAF